MSGLFERVRPVSCARLLFVSGFFHLLCLFTVSCLCQGVRPVSCEWFVSVCGRLLPESFVSFSGQLLARVCF